MKITKIMKIYEFTKFMTKLKMVNYAPFTTLDPRSESSNCQLPQAEHHFHRRRQ